MKVGDSTSNYEYIIQKIQDLNDRISEIDEQLEDINIDMELCQTLMDYIKSESFEINNGQVVNSLTNKIDSLNKKRDTLRQLKTKLVQQRIELSGET